MAEHFQDIFYDAYKYPLELKKEILKEALDKSYDWHLDYKDDIGSFQRKLIEDATIEDALKYLDEKCHFVIIHRKGYDDWKDKKWFPNQWCIEIGYSTISRREDNKTYYLFIDIDESYLDYFIEKYNLKKLS